MMGANVIHRTSPLTEAEKKRIRERRAAGVPLKVLRQQFRVSDDIIRAVLKK